MRLADESSLKKTKWVQWKSVEGEAVLLHAKTGNFFALDEVGTFLWQKLAKKNVTYGDLIISLIGEYNCDEPEARRDVLDFCGRLVAEELLEIM